MGKLSKSNFKTSLSKTVVKRGALTLVALLVVVGAVYAGLSARANYDPARATNISIGSQTRSVEGVNRDRANNTLVVYTYSSSQTSTPTNQYGIEVVVNKDSGIIQSINNRLASGSTSGTTIPSNGYVLSGHGWGVSNSGYEWLLANAKVGAVVNINGVAPGSAGTASSSLSIGSANHAIDGTNTTRSTNQLIMYTYSTSQTVAPTNQFGIEVVIDKATGAVRSVNNRLASGSTSGTTIPSNGYVLSGHGWGVSNSGYEWLLANAKVGAVVKLNNVASTNTATVTGSYDPTKASSISIGGNSHSVDGVNKTRDISQLIVYTSSSSQASTPTNQYGIEVLVNRTTGIIQTINNRLVTGSTSGTTIPSNGYVLSGHGWGVSNSGYEWLLANAKVGAVVNINGVAPGSAGTTGGGNDTSAPTISLISPSSGLSTNIGSTVSLAASAVDNTGVTKVEFYVDGNVVNTDWTFPYAATWSTSGASAGTSTVSAKAYDASNNVATSNMATIAVNGASTTPIVQQPPSATSGSIVGAYRMTWDGPAVSQVTANAPQYNLLWAAFAIGSDSNGNVEFTPYNESQQTLINDIKASKDAGKKWILSLGGGSDKTIRLLNSTHANNMYNSLVKIIDTYGFQGIDFDFECGTSCLSPDAGAQLAQMLKSRYGSGFIVSAAPRPYEVRGASTVYGSLLQKLGSNLDLVGLQFYDFTEANNASQLASLIDQDINTVINLGVPASKILIGCITYSGYGSGSNTVDVYKNIYLTQKQKRPTLRGVFIWDTALDQRDGWAFAKAMGPAVLGR